MALTLIGYFLKHVQRPESWCPDLVHVHEICSVSACISTAPDGWMDHWQHNAMGLFDDEALALSIVPEHERGPFTLFAYRMHPEVFDQGEMRIFPFPPLNVSPIPQSYQRIGYDAVGRSDSDGFACSPLSCNSLADHYTVNEYCLIEGLDEARQIAINFSVSACEPGSYCVVEVWRKMPPRS